MIIATVSVNGYRSAVMIRHFCDLGIFKTNFDFEIFGNLRFFITNFRTVTKATMSDCTMSYRLSVTVLSVLLISRDILFGLVFLLVVIKFVFLLILTTHNLTEVATLSL